MGEPQDGRDFVPVPQSRIAFDRLSVFGDQQVEKSMNQMSELVREIAPRCVALSLTIAEGDLTFTMMTDRTGAAMLDAMQYLDGGPCVTAVEEQQVVTTSDLPTDEDRWRMFARGAALAGISSTLSLPVMREGQAVGGVNLYGASDDTFDGHHEELADACGAWAAGAITNADLGFTSRVRAATAPARLQDQGDVDIAVGAVAEHQQIDAEDALSRIRQAAARATISDAEFARFILDAHAHDIA